MRNQRREPFMADIVIGQKPFFNVSNETAAMFVSAGLGKYLSDIKAEQPPAQPAAPTTDTFTCGSIARELAEPLPCITLRRPDGSTTSFTGAPEHAKTAFQTMLWSAAEQKKVLQGPVPPDAVIAEYLRKYPQDPAVVMERKRLAVQQAQAEQDKQNGVKRW
jgi:hypothetical protein